MQRYYGNIKTIWRNVRPVVLRRYANTRFGGASTPKNKVPTDFVGGLIISGGDEVFPRPAGGGAVGHS